MGGRGAKASGSMASEVISTSGASSVGVSGAGGQSSAARGEVVGVGSASETEDRKQQQTRPDRERDRPDVVPDKRLSEYKGVYTDKAEYAEFRKWSDDRFAESLEPGERSALGYYKGSGYTALNAELRGFQSPTAKNKGYTKSLDSALNGKTLGRDLVVYRGFQAGFDHEVGLIYQDKGFLSTSLNPNRAFGGNTFLKVHASAKTTGSFIETAKVYNKKAAKGLLHGMAEHEVLFARGTSYMVVGKSKVKTMSGERDAFDVVLLERG